VSDILFFELTHEPEDPYNMVMNNGELLRADMPTYAGRSLVLGHVRAAHMHLDSVTRVGDVSLSYLIVCISYSTLRLYLPYACKFPAHEIQTFSFE